MPFQFRKEAIEEELNSNFPSQGQGNPPLYYSLSEVVVPTYSINSVTEGSGLPENLQTAWDFSTGSRSWSDSTQTLITNTGFWKVDLTCFIESQSAGIFGSLQITDGIGSKTIWRLDTNVTAGGPSVAVDSNEMVVFLRSGDSLTGTSSNINVDLNVVWRQIADVNGTLVNPLGFSFA